MTDTSLAEVAALLRERNAVDARLAHIIGRPPEKGHLSEWIAAQIFDIDLETSASHKAIDGQFRSGALAGRTVNIKWLLKREGGLDLTESPDLHYYLVLTGPTTAASSSRAMTRPAVITAVYLFDAVRLLAEQRARRVKVGVFSSVVNAQWQAAQIYPSTTRARPSRLPTISAACLDYLPAELAQVGISPRAKCRL
jgi:hypothetical protein